MADRSRSASVYVSRDHLTAIQTFAHMDALTGEKLGLQVTKRVRLDQYLHLYPKLSAWGQYRFDTSSVLSFKVSTKLSLNMSAIDLYLSNPPPGNQKNNITFSTGVGYTF